MENRKKSWLRQENLVQGVNVWGQKIIYLGYLYCKNNLKYEAGKVIKFLQSVCDFSLERSESAHESGAHRDQR